MDDPVKIYTPSEANKLIPRLMQILPELRLLVANISKEKDQSDIEELSSFGMTGKAADEIKAKIDQHKKNVLSLELEFEKKLTFFEEIGCDLKSINPGLVDFFAHINGELAYLCWKEGEEEIRWWHSITDGFAGRQELE